MLFIIVLVVSLLANTAPTHKTGNFTYNDFRSANLSLDGLVALAGNGLLNLTNGTKNKKCHAFFPNPIKFKNSSNGTVHLFSTTFVFAIIPEYPDLNRHGFTFVIAPRGEFPGARPSYHFGVFNETGDGKATNHIFAMEIDTIRNNDFHDINENHVGIDVNGLVSIKSSPAGYTENNIQGFKNLSLISGKCYN